MGGKLKTSDFEPKEENVGKLEFERWFLMLEGASEAIQSHNIKRRNPEKMANLGLKILGSCILLSQTQHKRTNFELICHWAFEPFCSLAVEAFDVSTCRALRMGCLMFGLGAHQWYDGPWQNR